MGQDTPGYGGPIPIDPFTGEPIPLPAKRWFAFGPGTSDATPVRPAPRAPGPRGADFPGLSYLQLAIGRQVEEVRPQRPGTTVELIFASGLWLALIVDYASHDATGAASPIEELTGRTLRSLESEADWLILRFDEGKSLSVDLRDEASYGPETMEFGHSHPGTLRVIWQGFDSEPAVFR